MPRMDWARRSLSSPRRWRRRSPDSQRVNGHRDYITKVVLHGLAGPVDGKTYTDMMIPMHNFDDEWIAAVASYVRHNFGNTGGFITPADVARVRAAMPIARPCGRFLS